MATMDLPFHKYAFIFTLVILVNWQLVPDHCRVLALDTSELAGINKTTTKEEPAAPSSPPKEDGAESGSGSNSNSNKTDSAPVPVPDIPEEKPDVTVTTTASPSLSTPAPSQQPQGNHSSTGAAEKETAPASPPKEEGGSGPESPGGNNTAVTEKPDGNVTSTSPSLSTPAPSQQPQGNDSSTGSTTKPAEVEAANCTCSSATRLGQRQPTAMGVTILIMVMSLVLATLVIGDGIGGVQSCLSCCG